MNVLGIIAEYNPFHKGHAYQIETLKKETQKSLKEFQENTTKQVMELNKTI